MISTLSLFFASNKMAAQCTVPLPKQNSTKQVVVDHQPVECASDAIVHLTTFLPELHAVTGCEE